MHIIMIAGSLLFALTGILRADDVRPTDLQAAAQGLQNMLVEGDSGLPIPSSKADANLFENIWQSWEPELKAQARSLDVAGKRRMAFRRYGLIENPQRPNLPIGFLPDKKGRMTINCLACHSGQVAGQFHVGLPNWKIDLHTLYEDVKHLDQDAGWKIKKALNISKGLFGPERGVIHPFHEVAVALLFRKKNMDRKKLPNIRFDGIRPKFMSSSLNNAVANPPAWWTTRKKTHLFSDGSLPYQPKLHITAAVSPMASGSDFRAQEPKMQEILKLADSTRPPRFPGVIIADLAAQGRTVFENKCKRCHGTYESTDRYFYPGRAVSLGTVKTDPEFATNDGMKHLREFFKKSWLYEENNDQIRVDRQGYQAPPLDGIWASAPYLHNGSVPTLEDLLLPAVERPVVWLADDDSYDFERVGLNYVALKEVPADTRYAFERRRYYDTRKVGRGAYGHEFSSELSPEDKKAILEYLKTL